MSSFAVLTAVDELAKASEQASLVHLGLSTGLLAHCSEWVTMTELAAAINVPEASVTTVCTALVALGALTRMSSRGLITRERCGSRGMYTVITAKGLAAQGSSARPYPGGTAPIHRPPYPRAGRPAR
jgi:DNA-binding MarR family transcriptional regulator